MHKQEFQKGKLSLQKKLTFSLITIVGVFFIIEVLLSLTGYQAFLADDPYVGFQSGFPLFILDQEKGIYQTAQNKLTYFNQQSFPAKKAKNTYRIFTLGGSTTYGRPYFDSTSFSGWLRAFVHAANPERNWEIINAGGVSYASYRVASLMEELIQYEPDMFIVYSGHNEFLESRTYSAIIDEPKAVTRLKLILGNFRIYSFFYDIEKKLTSKKSNTKANQTRELESEVTTLLDNSVGPDAYSRDDAKKNKILAHYKFNLNRMTELAKSKNAEIVFVSPPVNAKDFSPFKSQHKYEMSKEEKITYDKELTSISLDIDRRKFDDIVQRLNKLIESDNRYALTYYEKGRVLFAKGQYNHAKKNFLQAVDEDICPLRALTPMGNIVQEIASKNNVNMIPLTQILESMCMREYGHTILGEEYFLDHVHPRIQVNQLLGLELFNLLTKKAIVRPNASWGDAKIKNVVLKVEKEIDENAHAHAKKTLARVLIWAGKTKEAARFAETSARLLKNDAEAQFHYGYLKDTDGNYEEAIAAYKSAIELNPDYARAYNNLVSLLYSLGRIKDAMELAQQALIKFPDNALVHNNYGQILVHQKRFEESIKSFKKSLKLNSMDAFVYANLGLAYSFASMNEEAIKCFSVSLELKPDDMETKRYLGLVFASEGRYEEAVFQFKEILKKNPANAQVAEYVRQVNKISEAN